MAGIYIAIFVFLIILTVFLFVRITPKSTGRMGRNIISSKVHMTVHELIEELGNCNPDAVVMLEIKDYYWSAEQLISVEENAKGTEVYLADY